MAREPESDRPAAEASAPFASRFGAWRVAALVWLVLLAGCVAWLAAAGFAEASASTGFQYLVVATLILGIVVAGRVTMRPLREGAPLDRRNIMDWSRRGLWRRWGQP